MFVFQLQVIDVDRIRVALQELRLGLVACVKVFLIAVLGNGSGDQRLG